MNQLTNLPTATWLAVCGKKEMQIEAIYKFFVQASLIIRVASAHLTYFVSKDGRLF